MKKFMMLTAVLMMGTSCLAMDKLEPQKAIVAKPTKREEDRKSGKPAPVFLSSLELTPVNDFSSISAGDFLKVLAEGVEPHYGCEDYSNLLLVSRGFEKNFNSQNNFSGKYKIKYILPKECAAQYVSFDRKNLDLKSDPIATLLPFNKYHVKVYSPDVQYTPAYFKVEPGNYINLQSLSLNKCPGVRGFLWIEKLIQLKCLDLEELRVGEVGKASVNFLSQFTNLNHLSLSNSSTSWGKTLNIASLPTQLTSLNLQKNHLDESQSHLQNLIHLKTLNAFNITPTHFSLCMGGDLEDCARGTEDFIPLTSLTSLWISYSNESNMQNLQGLTSLRDLCLTSNKQVALAHLSTLTNLQRLTLPNVHSSCFTDDQLNTLVKSHLPRVTEIKRLGREFNF